MSYSIKPVIEKATREKTKIQEHNKTIAYWLFIVCIFIAIMVVLGGWVRLTSSGLSIVEWKVITGILPPLNQDHWVAEFQKYQQTPQYQQINPDMTLADFKFIYYMEYMHRLLGRIAGLVLVIPFLIFWAKGKISRESLPSFVAVALLFALQGVFGWFMVKSGLVDQPRVSHYRLTGHLLLALALLAACFWLALTYYYGSKREKRITVSSRTKNLIRALPYLFLLQIALGGMVAGLRAGLVSNTFPKMAGAWVPAFIWSMHPWYKNFLENPFMLHFLHRWVGIFILLAVLLAVFQIWQERSGPYLKNASALLFSITLSQVFLGIVAIRFQVPVPIASLHQTSALLLFLLSWVMFFRIYKIENQYVYAKEN